MTHRNASDIYFDDRDCSGLTKLNNMKVGIGYKLVKVRSYIMFFICMKFLNFIFFVYSVISRFNVII